MKSAKRFFDLAAFFFFALAGVTGGVLGHISPELALRLRGIPLNVGINIFGLPIGEWIIWHRAFSVLSLIAMLPNLAFEGTALVQMARRRPVDGSPIRALSGLVSALVLGVMAFGPKASDKPPVPYVPEELQQTMDTKTLDQLTLKDIEKNMGVPQSFMRQRLKLGAEAAADLPLSFLKPRYGFSISDVVQAVSDYNNQSSRESGGR